MPAWSWSETVSIQPSKETGRKSLSLTMCFPESHGLCPIGEMPCETKCIFLIRMKYRRKDFNVSYILYIKS